MLEINNLHASVDDKSILKGLNLSIAPGEVHAIMGPNGSGKSTLANVIAGRDNYEVTEGSITFLGQDLLALPVEERVAAGVFLAFQYPVEIPGVSNINFLKASVNALRKARGQDEYDAMDFLKVVKQKTKEIGMDQDFLYRNLNEGFSGGEKKRNEILQLSLLAPKLAILDETDSGLDIDALKAVADGINRERANDRSILMVTHYQRLLDYVVPDYVHVMSEGKIIRSGDKSLALELEAKGYQWIAEQQSA